MKASWWISTFLASTVLSIDVLPFSPPQNAETNKRALQVLQILKRSDNCPSGYSGCSSLGDGNICCKDDSTCSRDAADNIACCPTGASCTGSLTATSTTTTNGFAFPSSATASATTGPGDATITGSTMPGAYPFVYVPTTFSNAETCSSYYSLCQSSYTGCLSSLGGNYAVTVAADGGGITQGAGATPGAVSTCSSLSADACHGLNLGYCGSYGGSNENGASVGRTSLQDLVLGLVVGVAGMFI
ncbi:hypothetical protein ASPWEDRAFT_178345 [Aspergillus wentii DTO 134E9]|uniref:Uncharacterized protein n=1 Tax=Aspergillus wentii DTO 134E9 TaxID=1073089 RepID=A0A1L9RZY5_ASPWE|nr:uncharacterized protein ASPWEDRAFT_178345 [Aspergillus wentii DTO 134E9]OJJ40496.1 hypothetical protein ASPWEDRAFT_178345 [Aspergillus wentii DTO 134E9]